MNKILRKYWFQLLCTVFCIIISLFFFIKMQLAKAQLIDLALNEALLQNMAIIGFLLLYALFYEVFTYLYSVFQNRYTKRTTCYLQKSFFQRIFKYSMADFHELTEGALLAKFTNQINSLERDFFGPFAQLVQMLLQSVFIAITLFYLNFNIAIFCVFLFTGAVFVPKLMEKRVFEKAQEKMTGFEHHLEGFTDWIFSMELIQNFKISSVVKEKFHSSNTQYYHKESEFEREFSKSFSLSYLVTLLSRGLVVLYLSYLVFVRELSPGMFFSILSLAEGFARPMFWMSKRLQELISVRPILKSIDDFLNVEEETSEKTFLDPKKDLTIHFDQVSFGFDDKDLFHDLSMDFKPKGKYLIMGSSGSGKSTCFKLLLRHYPLRKGQIVINDVPVDEIANLYDLLTYTAQEATLFNESLEDNLSLFDQKKNHDFSLLDEFGLSSFHNAKYLESVIKEEGVNFSGGEKKRLSLVRSSLRKRPIMIFDEPLANLDPENVDRIENYLLQLDATVIIISHQFTPEKRKLFDKIYYFKEGICHEEIPL
ncbi:MAG: ABC transporter ATP-binding protein [Tissierellia bacterium]|nr:ABC transporter ATP-binding protein [Tissierellia bacterium]